MKSSVQNCIPERDRDFFVLLRAGLWNKKAGALSSNPDWKYIFRTASEQNVLGTVTEGILVMDAKSGISEEMYDHFVVGNYYIEDDNVQINKLQASLCQVLAEHSVPYVVLKGQSLARLYPVPEKRTCGDIDFLVDEECFHRAIALFSPFTSAEQIHSEAYGHHEMKINGFPVEIHSMAKSHFINRFDRVLERERRKMFAERAFEHYRSEGTDISIPSARYSALLLFGHILRHLSSQGISLKQLCDWTLFIRAGSGRIDMTEFMRLLDDAGIVNMWRSFSAFAVEWLGAAPCGLFLYDRRWSGRGDAIWRPVRELRDKGRPSPQEVRTGYWSILLYSYYEFLVKQKYIWKISKRDYVRRVYEKFSPMPFIFLKKALRIGGDKFHKERFNNQ